MKPISLASAMSSKNEADRMELSCAVIREIDASRG